MQYELFGKQGEIVAKSDLKTTIEKGSRSNNWNPTFTTTKWSWAKDPEAEWLKGMAGIYVSYCDKHQGGKHGFAGRNQAVKGYGFSA